MKRLFAVLVVLSLLCGFCTGCRQNEPSDSSLSANLNDIQTADTFTVAYNREDTLNPYTAKTELNLQLASLLYETPVTIDETFMRQEALLTVTMPDPSHILTNVRAGAKFSDGTTVTAEDVRFSFEQAKNSENYATLLANIASVTVKGKDLTFTLVKADVNADANLIFPVIKRSTATDNAGQAPIGSGPYVYDAEKALLTANPYYHGTAPAFSTIGLKHLVNETEVLQALENGSIHYMYSDLSGEIPRTMAKTTAIDLTRLVYLGVNAFRPLTADTTFRQAISAAINRTAIAANSYTGRALPAVSPFHSKWGANINGTVASASDNTALAKQLLAQSLNNPVTTAPTATVTATGTTTTVTTTAATTTTTTTAATSATDTAIRPLTLIYVAGNTCRESAIKMIVSALGDCGITVTPAPLTYSEYITRLQNGDFDIYFGEIQLLPSMSQWVFLRTGGTASYGIYAPETAAAYASMLNAEQTAETFLAAFSKEMPYIPLCWRQGMAAYTDAFSSVKPSAFFAYDGISEWK